MQRPDDLSGAPSPHRAGRRNRRMRQRPRAGRFLWLTALGTLVPGTGLIAAGRRSGKAVLTLLVIGVLGAGLFLWQTSLDQLTRMATNQSQLMALTFGMLLIAAGWLAVALASHRALEPDGLSDGKRLAGSLVVVAAASIVITPLALGAQTAWTARSLIGNIASNSDTTPEVEDAANPWEGVPRVSVLLMGGDGGIGRQDVRPDTLILASIDTETGDTVMFSLPRHLERPPFPEGTAMHEHYPDGFTDIERGQINAVYNNTPEDVLEDAFPNSSNPSADATKQAVEGTLGVSVDYYVLANLAGFEQIIDAMGGVTIDVPYPVPMGTKVNDAFECVWSGPEGERWIEPGEERTLNGTEALWFARSRCAPYNPAWPDQTGLQSPITLGYNHNRMERQRCMMSAIAASANPTNLLTKFQSLASATEDAVATDIPPDLWPKFAELGMKVKDAEISSIVFNKEGLAEAGAGEAADPDFDAIAAAVDEALAPDPEPTPDESATSTEEPGSDGGEQSEQDEQTSDETGSTTPEPEPTDQSGGTATC